MASFFQFESIREQIKLYIASIILSTKKKNCLAMSREVGIPEKKLYAALACKENDKIAMKSYLLNLSKKHTTKSLPSVLIIDPTHISKWFSKKIEKVALEYDGVVDKAMKSLVPVVAAWSNSKITIPLDFLFWVNKRFTDSYKKKSTIACDLIAHFVKVLKIDYVVLDGAFASLEVIEFFFSIKVDFCIRIAKNRIIISASGISEQLQNHPDLKLRRNEHCRTIRATYKGLPCYFTAHKMISKNRKVRVVFIVSSLNIPAKEQAKIYRIRWNIEKMFRTMKQSLGLNDCQSTNSEKQAAHILSIFLAYARLEEQKKFKRKKSTEEILAIIRPRKQLKSFQKLPVEYVELCFEI